VTYRWANDDDDLPDADEEARHPYPLDFGPIDEPTHSVVQGVGPVPMPGVINLTTPVEGRDPYAGVTAALAGRE